MFSFKLNDDFVQSYVDKEVPWGFPDAGGNSVGEITFIRSYSRKKEDGTKESWVDVCRRVIEGMYSVQKDHVKENRLPWSGQQAQASAQEAFDRLFNLKWCPPGRGLWMMGTPFVLEQKNSAALQNCAFISTKEMTKNDPSYPFRFLMEASMLGVGVGFDSKGASKEFTIHQHAPSKRDVVIEDSREGWVQSVGLLIDSYLKPDQPCPVFDYGLIRGEGEPIKGFGGVSSGPKPLMVLHTQLSKILSSRVGEKVDSRLLADIGNLIGVCVVSGNVRRSAELYLGDPEDKDFLNLKNGSVFPERNYWSATAPAEELGWGWMSNNSLYMKVGSDYSPYIDAIKNNGEPGFVWMDITRAYGRLVDAPDNKDWRAEGFNPCVTEDTWVQTAEGPRQVRELIGTPFTALVDGKPYDTLSSGFWLTGSEREVFDVVTDDGHTVRVTSNHQMLTQRGWVEAGDLVLGDSLLLNDHSGSYWHGRGGFNEGYLLGQLWGDGTLKKEKAVLSLWGEGKVLAPYIEDMARSMLKLRSDWKGFGKVPGRDEIRLNSSDLVTLAASWGMTHGNKKISDSMERGSWEFYRGFLQAAFDCDGHVEGSMDKGVTVRLAQSDLEQLQRVQRMLGRMGIQSKIHDLRPEGAYALPGGDYLCKASFRLIISGKNASSFMELIGFLDPNKAAKWERLTSTASRGFYSKPPVSKFVKLLPAGTADVYDVTVADVHRFDANGFVVHNCVEQPLESGECCTLVETFINRHESLEDYLRTLKFAYLYGKTVTLLPTHWPQTNAIMQRNRRIGTSVSGVAEFADTRGVSTLINWFNKGFDEVSKWDRVYSEWLCVRESIRKTTGKPSGSVSLLAGTTPGFHWGPGGQFCLRSIRFAKTDPMVPLFEAAGYTVEDAVTDRASVVVYFPVKGSPTRADSEVSIFEKAHLASIGQRHWSDNSISVTVSFDPEKEGDDIARVLNMYEGQLKSISFLPRDPNSYPQMPYTQISEEQYNSYVGKLSKIDFSPVYNDGVEALGEKFCSNDVCEIPSR